MGRAGRGRSAGSSLHEGASAAATDAATAESSAAERTRPRRARAYDGAIVSMEKGADSAGGGDASQGAVPKSALARVAPWLALPYAIALATLLLRQGELPGLLHDDAIYVAMARGIEQGVGPIDTHLVEGARSARFPPLYPAVLAATRAPLGVAEEGVAGTSRWIALNGLFLGIAWLAFVQWLVAWRRFAPVLAIATALCAFTLPFLLGLAQQLMSESLFVAQFCVALWLHERSLARPGRGAALAAGVVAGLLPATRTIGAAVVVGLALHRRLAKRPVALFAAGAALPWLAAAAWSAVAGRGGIESPLFGPPYRELLLSHLGDAPWIAWVNAVRFSDWLAYALAPQWPLADGSSLPAALLRLLPAALLVAAALLATLRERRHGEVPPAHRLALAGCVALLLPWPFPDLRFVLPLAPFAVAALAALLRDAAARVAPRGANVAAAVALLLLTGWNGPMALSFVAPPRADADAPTHAARPAPFFGRPIDPAPFAAAAAELRRRVAAEPAAFASSLDSLLSLQSGARGATSWVNDDPFRESYLARGGDLARLYYAPLPPERALDAMFARVDEVQDEYRRLGIRWLVVPRVAAAGAPTCNALVDRMLERDRTRPRRLFTPAWRSADGAIELWRFDP